MDNPKNLGELFLRTANRYPTKTAFLYKSGGKYSPMLWSEVLLKVHAIASALLEKGLKPGDRIAILSENRPEWAMIDLAAQTISAISVPIYTSLTSNEIQYILSDCGARMIAVSNKTLFQKIAAIQASLPELQAVIGFESPLTLMSGDISVPLLLIKNLEGSNSQEKIDMDKCSSAIGPETIASIIYTSGTTGPPKGVMLTHENFISNAVFCKTALKMGETDIHLSFLPLSHVFERLAGYYLMIYIGATIAYAESMDAVPQNLLEIRPTFILGVPRFYEKINSRVVDAIEKSSSVKKGLFYWAKALGQERREALGSGKKFSWIKNIELAIAEILVYKKFSQRLGGRIRFCVSGGAPLSKEMAEFFFDLGVMICEGYGLTETSPVIAANRLEKFKFGTVGIPLNGLEVKISEEGEIVTRGPCVMKGYYNKPDETASVLKDGWFYTGDLGVIDREGFLVITGRKKELIVTSGGKKVAPRAIEELMEKNPLIARCVLFGEGKKFITALIVPRQDKVVQYATEQKIAYHQYSELLTNSSVYHWIEKMIADQSCDLASFEQIKYFLLLENDFSQDAGELTPTLKVKRDVIFSRYKDRLLALYGNDKS